MLAHVFQTSRDIAHAGPKHTADWLTEICNRVAADLQEPSDVGELTCSGFRARIGPESERARRYMRSKLMSPNVLEQTRIENVFQRTNRSLAPVWGLKA